MSYFKDKKDTFLQYYLSAISIITAIGLIYYLISKYSAHNNFPTTPSELGTLGDYFGGFLNPTIAGLALIWLIRSVSIQVTELKKTNEALESTVETAKQQQQQISIQNFENLFFELLKVKSDATNEIIFTAEGNNSSVSLQGKNAIKAHIDAYKKSGEDWEPYYTKNLLDIFGSYFRICYQIVKLIDNNPILSKLDKNLNKPYTIKQKEYFDLFRASLTQYELEAFFFNCLSSYGNGKFKKLIEKYGLFEPLLLNYNNDTVSQTQPIKFAYKYHINAFEYNRNWLAYFIHIESIEKLRDLDKIDSDIRTIILFKSKFYILYDMTNSHLFSREKYLNIIREYLDTYADLYNDINELEDLDGIDLAAIDIYRFYSALISVDFAQDVHVFLKYDINPKDFINFKMTKNLPE